MIINWFSNVSAEQWTFLHNLGVFMSKITTNYIGVEKHLSNDDYHKLSALGASTLNKGRQSMAHVKAAIDGKLKFNQARMDLGTVAHSLCLEQDTSKFVKGPDVSSKAVKAWKEFVEANPDKIVLTPEEHDELMALFDKFCAHPFASKITDNARIEESHFTIDAVTGIWLKARPDAVLESRNIIVDYKTAAVAKPKEFARAIFNYGYDISAAHYRAVVEQTTGVAIDGFYWIVQEIKPPFEIMVYRASKLLMSRALAERNSLLDRIKKCTETNVWPGYDTEIIEIDIPDYLVGEPMEVL